MRFGSIGLFAASLALASSGASAQALKPGVRPPVSAGGLAAKFRQQGLKLSRKPIVLGAVDPSTADMTGWTAVTKGSATSAPALFVDVVGPALLVRGNDGVLYVAPVNLGGTQPIDPATWSAVAISASRVACQSPQWPVLGPVNLGTCTAYSPGAGAKGFMLSRNLEDASNTFELFWQRDLPGSPVKGAAQLATLQELKTRALGWDGAQTLYSLSIEWGGYDPVPAWTKLNFYAFAEPACVIGGPLLGWCLMADGGGDKLTVWNVTNKADAPLTKLADLPPVPGGGGMSKGEYAMVRDSNTALHVIARGKDGKVWVSTRAANSFGPWKALGGSIAAGSPPACVAWKGKPACAIRAPDKRIYVRYVVPVAGGL